MVAGEGKIMLDFSTHHKLGILQGFVVEMDTSSTMPAGLSDLILNGEPEEYLKKVAGSHGLED